MMMDVSLRKTMASNLYLPPPCLTLYKATLTPPGSSPTRATLKTSTILPFDELVCLSPLISLLWPSSAHYKGGTRLLQMEKSNKITTSKTFYGINFFDTLLPPLLHHAACLLQHCCWHHCCQSRKLWFYFLEIRSFDLLYLSRWPSWLLLHFISSILFSIHERTSIKLSNIGIGKATCSFDFLWP